MEANTRAIGCAAVCLHTARTMPNLVGPDDKGIPYFVASGYHDGDDSLEPVPKRVETWLFERLSIKARMVDRRFILICQDGMWLGTMQARPDDLYVQGLFMPREMIHAMFGSTFARLCTRRPRALRAPDMNPIMQQFSSLCDRPVIRDLKMFVDAGNDTSFPSRGGEA